jgi:hypothetical protein
MSCGCERSGFAWVVFPGARSSCAPCIVPGDDEHFRVTLFGDVDVIVGRSALRHGVSMEVLCHVIENAIAALPIDPDDLQVELMIGPGPAGEPYEVLVRHGGVTPRVFHAMPLRRSIAQRWGGMR